MAVKINKGQALNTINMTPVIDMVFLLLEGGADFRQKNSVGDDVIGWIQSKKRFFDDGQKVWLDKSAELLKSKGAVLDLPKE